MPATDISARLVSESEHSFALLVCVREGDSETKHDVTLRRDLLLRLSPNESADAFVRRCFEFLLARESKESILRRFDISVIGRYFPEFEKKIATR
jgi:hypothetical protein